MEAYGIYIQRKAGGWILADVVSAADTLDAWYRLRDFSLDNPSVTCKILSFAQLTALRQAGSAKFSAA